MRGALLGLCALALIVGGFLFGQSVQNDSEATVERAASVAAAQTDGADIATSNTVATDDDSTDDASADAGDERSAVAPLISGDGEIEPIVAVAEAVGPSVVLITTATGQGSGIIYDASGLIITNAHVVQGATDVTVMLPDGLRVEGEIIGSDDFTDIAMVKIDSELGFVPATFAPIDTLKVGQLSVAIGSPFGLEQTVTAGIISALNRPVSLRPGQPTRFFVQTDAPINPGNSGGALADRQGRVIGMNTLIRTDGATQGNVGVGFAIPTDTMQFVAERLIVGEEVKHAFLGIEGGDPDLGEPGALINKVSPGFPAEAAGLLRGDRIVSFDEKPITGMAQLAATVRLSPQNELIEVTVIRDGEEVSFDLELVPPPGE